MGLSESFMKRADRAAFYEAWVGAVLARAKLYTMHNPFPADGSPGHEQDCDLMVSKDAFVWDSLEVKAVRGSFTGPQDYPFDRVLVCSQASFLRKWPGSSRIGADFFIVSMPTGSAVWIPKGTTVEMGVEVFDRERGHSHLSVAVSKKDLRDLRSYVERFHGDGSNQ